MNKRKTLLKGHWPISLFFFLFFLNSIFADWGTKLFTNPMFGLREGNGREEKKNKGEGKNVGPSDRFLNKFSSFSSLMLSKHQKRFYFSSFPSSSSQTKHSVKDHISRGGGWQVVTFQASNIFSQLYIYIIQW